ncbi:uncharacterized protein LOC134828395 [Culicoides brevitarsis]|uniref:uncharacterized protein LOC134828395 n=1 Tax=Culicoides brevitarsis TaxID=469753 RepID=UPI00307C9D65
MNQLVEIPSNNWVSLRDLFLTNWPNDHVGYYLVDNYVKWVEKDPNIKNLAFYCLNGDWSDGTFVVIDRFQLFIYSKSDTNERLTELLRLLDWSKGFKVSSFRKKFRSAVLTVIDELSLEVEYDKERILFFMPREKASVLDVTPPEGYSLKPISDENHVQKVSEIWSNRDEGSFFFLQRLKNFNPNVGLFKNDSNELVSWCFRLQVGALGALQTDKNYLRRGFGSLVTRKMCKILAEMDQDTFALVDASNEASKRMFQKVGFELQDFTCKIRTKPSDPNFRCILKRKMKITKIPLSDWPSLRDLFKSDWPRNILPYHLVQNYLDWHQKDPDFVEKNIEICCLDGDWSDGTFYALDENSVFFYTLNEDLSKLVNLLSLLPRNNDYLGACVYARHFPVVEKLVSLIPEWEHKFSTKTFLHHIPRERGAAYDLEIPEGITIKPMHSDEHAATVDSVYPFRTEGKTVHHFKKLMKFNTNLGAFDAEDKLVAWCLVYQSGVLNALQVLDDGRKRRGLGSLMVKAMAKTMAEQGYDTFGCIVDGNVPSFNLFKKLGFDNIGEVYWTGFGSKNVSNFTASDPYAEQRNGKN